MRNSTNTKEKLPHVLFIDDDPVFRALVSKVAGQKDLPITVCASVQELAGMARPGSFFDVVIVDYFLDDLKETLRGTDIAAITPYTPTILISGTNQVVDDNSPWPSSIRKFVNKKAGIAKILDTAIQVYRSTITDELETVTN